MKSIKAKVLSLMLVIALALTGCASEDVGVKMTSGGNAVITVKMSIDKSAAEQAIREMAKEMGETASDAEIKEIWETCEKEMGMKLVTVNGKQYYQITETETIKKANVTKEFNSIGKNACITADTFYLTIDPAKLLGNEEEEMGMAVAMGVNMADYMTLNFSVEFPKNIVRTNGKIDSSNPKKANFTLSLTKAKTIFATTKKSVTTDTVKKSNTISKPKIKSLKPNKVKKTAKKATATLKFSKVSGAKNYLVQWSTKSSFKGAKKATIKKTTYKIKNLKKNTKYYVRVRAQKKNLAGDTVYSKWVKKTVKTKK